MRLTVEQPPPVTVEYALRMTAPELDKLGKELEGLALYGAGRPALLCLRDRVREAPRNQGCRA